jgi:hypothetical protein
MEKHMEALERLCRLCGGSYSRYRVSYAVGNHVASLKRAFSLDVDEDLSHVHPKSFCNKCYAILKRKENAEKENKVYLHCLEIIQWIPHSDDFCTTCSTYGTLRKGGRAKKSRKNRGAPSNNSCHEVMEHITSIALPELYRNGECLDVSCPQSFSISSSDYLCSVCYNPLNSPIKI